MPLKTDSSLVYPEFPPTEMLRRLMFFSAKSEAIPTCIHTTYIKYTVTCMHLSFLTTQQNSSSAIWQQPQFSSFDFLDVETVLSSAQKTPNFS